MHRMTILYGVDDDPDAFQRYYRGTHVPLASRMKGLTGWTLCWIDPASSSRYQLVAELYAESAEALDDVLASPAGRAASADLDNFVTGGVEFLRGDVVDVPVR